MTPTLTTIAMPLRTDAHGTIRVGRSRVMLDTVVTLAEVTCTIVHYL